MIIRESLLIAMQKLKEKKIDSARLDAEVLLCFVLKKDKAFIFAWPETKMTSQQVKTFNNLINKRIKGIPIAYLTGTKNFFGLDFCVNKNVLIPRPETEILVEKAINAIKVKEIVADVGTGSGCIAIAVAKNSVAGTVFSLDQSAAALAVAKKNAKKNGVYEKIIFKRGNLIAPLRKQKIDIILANLPYLNTKETIKLIAEPRKALWGGKKGCELYEKLIAQVTERKQKPRLMLFEIGETQAKYLSTRINYFLPKAKVSIIKDFCGFERFLQIQL